MPSTQSFIPLKTIKKDAVIMKDGSLRAILMSSSLNFSLMSADEQTAIIYRYQEFLNSLDFPTQIVVQSRKLNIKEYLKLLESKKAKQTNELLQTQTQEYIEFVKKLTEMTNIMVKMFYIVIPFYQTEVKKGGIIGTVKSIFWSSASKKESQETFLQQRDQLFQRVEFVQQTLRGAGIRLVPLKTPELIELYYGLYNPGLAEKEELSGLASLDME